MPEVRAFTIENALHWLHNYRFDGLRLDAVHAVTKRGNPSILAELSRAVGELARTSGRLLHLVLENDDNEAGLLEPAIQPPAGRYHAQWNDDYHHAWHVLLTGEKAGYYSDYADEPIPSIAKSLKSGFVYQGEPSQHRGGQRRGSSSSELSPAAFINFLQNHDQIGNRARGERLSILSDDAKVVAALSMLLLAPNPPLLFMGEEWGATTPFTFFCDFNTELANAVREGRRREFADAYSAADSAKIPDALDEATFRSSALNWAEKDRSPYSERLAIVESLLACRQQWIVPILKKQERPLSEFELRGASLSVGWRYSLGTLHVAANLSSEPTVMEPLPGLPVWNLQKGSGVEPWSVHWTFNPAV